MHRYTYAVGDIHGRLDLVRAAIEAIAKHAGPQSFRVVFLGDYVDRGPDSRGVIECLMELARSWPVLCLKGNHEDLMVRAVTRPDRANLYGWLANGGLPTLESYGVETKEILGPHIPCDHVRWLSGLPLTTGDRYRVFVHAGLLPKTPFHQQKELNCLWIREPFLSGRQEDFDTHVVHGHSFCWRGKPNPIEPELLGHRTNLDTAAFATGRLCIGVFDAAIPGGPVDLIKVSGEAMPDLLTDSLGDNYRRSAKASK